MKKIVLPTLAVITMIGLATSLLFKAQAQTTTVTFESPKAAYATSACRQASQLNLGSATEQQKAAIAAAKCVRVADVYTGGPNYKADMCGDDSQMHFIGQGLFSQLPAVNFATMSATAANSYTYPVDLCNQGQVCVVCRKESTTGTTTNTTNNQSGSASALPESGAWENMALLAIAGVALVGLGSYLFLRQRA